jgi:tetratricopeptide (TPR) repeat protein
LPDYIKDPADLRAAQISLAESMYENGDLDDARKVFTQTIASAKAAGDIEAEAESESTAGEIAFLQGQTASGETLTDHALKLSRKPGISPSVRVWTAVYYATNRERLGFRTDENLHMLEAAAQQARDHNLPPREIADVLYSLAFVLKSRDRLDEAEPIYNQALQVYSQDPQAQCDQSAVLGELASIEDNRGNPQASLPLYQRAYDGLKSCSGAESRGALEQQDRMAGALVELGRAQEALPVLESALPAWRQIAGSSPDLAEPLLFLSEAYVETGHLAEGEKAARELLTVQEGKVASTDRRLGASHLILARALTGQSRYQEALPHAEIAETLLSGAVSPSGKQMSAEASQELLDIREKLR